MKIYIYRNGRQEGPFHRDELMGLDIRPETSVWYSGLGSWTRADQAQCTRWLFDPSLQGEIRNWQRRKGCTAPPEYNPESGSADGSCFIGDNAGGGYGGYSYPRYEKPSLPKPSDYMALSIISLLVSLFTVPFMIFCGIMGIVKGNEVSQKYNTGDYTGAVQASKSAFKWGLWGLIITIGLIILGVLAYVLFYAFFIGLAMLTF